MAPLDLLFRLAWPLSPLYSAIMRLRAFCYRRKIFRSQRLPVPVVSIGNLTLGGTGKTPMVLYVARLLIENGQRPAVVSRGYGGASRRPVNVVSDGSRTLLSAEEAGDEPRLLADNLTRVPVLTGVGRAQVGLAAVENFAADCILLDDGFQHLALERDHDLVLFSANALLGNGRVFPGGPLREALAALSRARAFVVTGVDDRNRERVLGFKQELHRTFPKVPFFTARYEVAGVFRRTGGKMVGLDMGKIGAAYAFCGLANPHSFRRTLENGQVEVVGMKAFRDHHRCSEQELVEVAELAVRAKAACLITTEKDVVKLARDSVGGLPICFLKVSLQPEEGFDAFLLALLQGI